MRPARILGNHRRVHRRVRVKRAVFEVITLSHTNIHPHHLLCFFTLLFSTPDVFWLSRNKLLGHATDLSHTLFFSFKDVFCIEEESSPVAHVSRVRTSDRDVIHTLFVSSAPHFFDATCC